MNRTNSRSDERVEQGHEPNTVNVRVLMLSALGLVLLVAFVLLLMSGTIRLFARQESVQGEQTPGLRSAPTATGARVSAEQPRLLHELRRSEQQRLSNYEWIDKSAGAARYF